MSDDLTALREAATAAPWGYRGAVGKAHRALIVQEGASQSGALGLFDAVDWEGDPERPFADLGESNAAYIVALVNAHASGALVPKAEASEEVAELDAYPSDKNPEMQRHLFRIADKLEALTAASERMEARYAERGRLLAALVEAVGDVPEVLGSRRTLSLAKWADLRAAIEAARHEEEL